MIQLNQKMRKRWNTLSRFDSIMLGDNPFFGVDHLSHERGRARAEKYKTFDYTVDVIKCAHEYGMSEMAVGTRPRLGELINCIKKKSNLIEEINFNPILPYAQDYVLKVSEKGLMSTMKEVLGGAGIQNELKILTKGGLGFLKKDLEELFKVLIDVEILKLKDVKVKTVYLHPILTDLALALNLKGIFETFSNHLHDKYKLKIGLSTKNFPALVSKLDEWKLKIDDIMTSFNKTGFLMNPSRAECEKMLATYTGGVTAMNIFGGGYYGLEETHEYAVSLSNLKKIVVGASSVEHAKQTFSLFNK